MGNVRPSNKDAHDPLLKYGAKTKRNPKNLWKCCVVTAAIIVILLCLLFLIVFVGLPLTFKYSIQLQRMLVFPTNDLWPPDPEFTNFEKYNIIGVRNLYVNVNRDENIILGVWHILPISTFVNGSVSDNFNYTEALFDSKHPVVLHFHGNGGNRIADVDMYHILRRFFHIIAFDYRGYADSTEVLPSEDGIVRDSIGLYKWLRKQTNAKIYFWGHSLGAALSTHTIAKLKDEDIVPMGLFLEAPFTTLNEEIEEMSLTKVFSWLPWYESTMLKPLEENGFYFRTTENILKVDCPIMIIHAEDDENIPYTLGQKLYNIAKDKRDLITQGNVTFRLLPEYLECNHIEIYNAPDLPNYIRDHIAICEEFNESRN